METFKIQTLSERGLRKNINWKKYYLPHGYELKKRKRVLADRLGDPITGAVAVISSLLPQIFGSGIDPGHWEGSLFIPGDLNYRIAETRRRIAEAGLTQWAVDDEWLLILKTPGIWQEAITNYINNVLRPRSKGQMPMPQYTKPGGMFIPGSGLGISTEWLLIGGLGLMLLLSKKKRR